MTNNTTSPTVIHFDTLDGRFYALAPGQIRSVVIENIDDPELTHLIYTTDGQRYRVTCGIGQRVARQLKGARR